MNVCPFLDHSLSQLFLSFTSTGLTVSPNASRHKYSAMTCQLADVIFFASIFVGQGKASHYD